MKIKVFTIISIIIAALTVCCCEMFVAEDSGGVIEFSDFAEQEKEIGGNAGLLDFGTKTVELGARDILPLTIKNSGEGTLVITNIHILQTSAPDGSTDAAFTVVDGTYPALPLSIPAGKTVSDIFFEFAPDTAGDFRAELFVETEDDSYYVDLAGVGLWQLTLNGNDVSKLYILGDDGSPDVSVDGAAADPAIATSSDGLFTVLCELEFLQELYGWVNADGNAEIENPAAMKTTMVLSNHATVSADVRSPYIRVPDTDDDTDTDGDVYYDNLNNAIAACDGVNYIAVVICAGEYTIDYDVSLSEGVPVYGGYKSDWTEPRLYKTVSDRTTSAHQTVLNVSDTILISGSALKNNVALEGFTINKDGGDDDPLILFDNNTAAELRYNTITGGGTNHGAAVKVTNSATPLIKYNYITGGSLSADYADSYGIAVTEGAAPVIYKNNISGGAASGTDAKSYGIFCDFEAEPYIRNNTPLDGVSWGISGGSASGSGGKSYGIYIINNGHVLAEYNEISGGSGKTAIGLYSRYGSYIDAYYNNIYTEGGGTGIGLWADFSGRVYHLKHSGIYSCDTALYREWNTNYTDIGGVNSVFNTSTNEDAAVDLSEAPSEVAYE